MAITKGKVRIDKKYPTLDDVMDILTGDFCAAQQNASQNANQQNSPDRPLQNVFSTEFEQALGTARILVREYQTFKRDSSPGAKIDDWYFFCLDMSQAIEKAIEDLGVEDQMTIYYDRKALGLTIQEVNEWIKEIDSRTNNIIYIVDEKIPRQLLRIFRSPEARKKSLR